MYITTFYSFKGGVGRSMALVNAGIELAQRNRRVLLVDFDLEAPGLDTFNAFAGREPSKGIVDFVHSYLSSGTPDDVFNYVSKCPVETESGEIWLMPAGGVKTDYAGLFQNIDWGDLYANQDGFLLMEDLKQQWMDKIQPDYVLIDSRTGHTDLGGICTRQLPDAVAIFYFPNEQNRRGVSRVVREIRSEQDSPRKKAIQLIFIMSNVPDLDDEHQILEREIAEFKSQLALDEDPLMVHRYDSLSLLNQDVFTQSRPKSRLASEYREIVNQIVKGNLGDQEAALDFLKRLERRNRWRHRDEESTSREVRSKLDEIEKTHARDAEISYLLGSLYHREQELKRATSLYRRSIDLRPDQPEVYLDRARALADLGNVEEAYQDAMQALNSPRLSPRQISRALNFVDLDKLDQITTSNAVDSLDSEQKIRLITLIYFESEAKRRLALQLVPSVARVKAQSISDDRLYRELGLIFISMGQFRLATELFSVDQNAVNDIATKFNLAIASWGKNGSLDAAAFKKVIELHESKPRQDGLNDNANYRQCIALAYWATADIEKSLEYTEKSKLALEKYEQSFSCWRYLYVNQEEFLKDIDEMEKLINGDESVKPPFLKRIGESSIWD